MDLKNRMISLIVPVYNEREVLEESFARMNVAMRSLGCNYEIIYVDDGSVDGTWEILQAICARENRVKALSFSRNFGHQLAVTAGMDEARGDALVIIDVDLQDPPEVIPYMVDKWLEGYEVVYGKREKREGETAFKKLTATVYYRLLRALSAYPIPLDTGDFRLIDRSVADVLRSMRESNRFLRGMAAWAGFRQYPLSYVRHERHAGKTKYTLKKMIKLALDGILGFSNRPLTMPFVFGAVVMALTLAGFAAMLVLVLCSVPVAPWLWVADSVLLLQGFILWMMGVQGAYLARMYDEAKGRPLYIVSRKLNTTAYKPQQPNKQNPAKKESDSVLGKLSKRLDERHPQEPQVEKAQKSNTPKPNVTAGKAKTGGSGEIENETTAGEEDKAAPAAKKSNRNRRRRRPRPQTPSQEQ